MSLRVTVEDIEMGTTEVVEVDDYLLICSEPCYLSNRTAHRNGTHVLTVKNAVKPPLTISLSAARP